MGVPKTCTMNACRSPRITREWSPPRSLQSKETRDWAKTETPIYCSSNVSQTRAWCQSCEPASQLTQQSRKESLHTATLVKQENPGSVDSGLPGGQWWNCSKKKEASLTQIWLLKLTRKKRQKCSRKWSTKQKTGSGKASVPLSRDTTLTHFWLLRCKQQLPPPPPPTPTPRSHRCQWSSTEDKQGKELSTTPTLRPAEQSEQSG